MSTPWWRGVPPAVAQVSCHGREHQLRWAAGELHALGHPDLESEKILRALAGENYACLDVLEAWEVHAEDLRILILASRGPALTTDQVGTEIAGLISDRDLTPGQGGELGVQAGLVALDGEQVMPAALGDQVLGVSTLGMHRVCGGYCPGQVDPVQQGGEHRDLVCLGLDVHLSQDYAVGVIERSQQMPARTAGHA